MSESEGRSEARVWLKYAHEDLDAAQELIKARVSPRHVCFLAQQAAEKAIKAVLIFCQIAFPRTHDLEALTKLIPDGWGSKHLDPAYLAMLTEWAVEARYPGDWPVAEESDAQSSFSAAGEVVNRVTLDLQSRGLI